MLSERDIEVKDFSEAIPDLSAKMSAIGSALMTYGYQNVVLESEQCKGFGLVLIEVREDLDKIWKALYGDGRLPR
ncbi:conserved hypothetical protein [delta proteobacterium NaphS2]|nr:conserved hypothetical protein [delta proteobacterium NaphS2]